MTSSTSRTGRRRRILQEGAANPATAEVGTASGERVRYTVPPESASFAVATRVVPRSLTSWVGLTAGALAVTAALGWADGFGAALAKSRVNVAAARLLMVDQPGSLMAWWEAALWIAVAIQCVLLFGMRRHRTDDLGGGYRWWILVAATSVGLSVASATDAHVVVAAELAKQTGFSPLVNNAFWWLVPGGFLFTGIGVRSLLEVRESRAAFLFAMVAAVATLGSALATSGLLPAAVTSAIPWLGTPLVGPIAGVVAVLSVSLTLLAYSRRIVQESLGEVAPPVEKRNAASEEESVVEAVEEKAPTLSTETAPTASSPTKVKKSKPRLSKATVVEQEPASQADPEPQAPAEMVSKRERKRTQKAAKAASSEDTGTQWVSGGEDYSDDYGDAPPRKLSKAERKRLRREKARRAA